jgi:hypothetical protein
MARISKEHVVKISAELDNAVIVRPGDKLICATPHALSHDQAAAITAHLRKRLPRVSIVIIDQCSGLAVYRDEPQIIQSDKPLTAPDAGQPDDKSIEQWILAHNQKFEVWLRRYNRIHGGLGDLRATGEQDHSRAAAAIEKIRERIDESDEGVSAPWLLAVIG